MLWPVFILSFLLIKGVISEEPRCSRFHYDDQLLEKMIRMEVKVEAMEKVIVDANKQMLDRQNELQESLIALKSERADLKSDYANLKTKIVDDFNEMRDILLTPTIVFKARQPVDISLETGQTVVFSKIMKNEDDAYDNVTGIFTAPVAGTYLFTIHVCLNSGKDFYYGIMCNNRVETSGRFYGSVACNTADAILVLEPKQKVWLKCLYGGTSNVLYEYSSSTYNYWNTFSGVLIHK